jgi:hypothetical protein
MHLGSYGPRIILRQPTHLPSEMFYVLPFYDKDFDVKCHLLLFLLKHVIFLIIFLA